MTVISSSSAVAGAKRAGSVPAHPKLLIDRRGRLDRSPRGKIDAIVVPSGRRAHHLRQAAQLSADYGTRLVVLASLNCSPEDAADVVAGIPGARGEILDARADPLADHQLRTSDVRFRGLSPGRHSDLSRKRNLGLVHARLRGFRSIVFMDDDIHRVTPNDLSRLARQLEIRRVAGMLVTSFPDNSVLMHANRLADPAQGVFATGAVLAVRCDQPVGFFPDVYNEDWFFFAAEAAGHGIVTVGEACQRTYTPFDPMRAVTEEFGDLVAEGLYSLFEDGGRVEHATVAYWDRAIAHRHAKIRELRKKLRGNITTNESTAAQEALKSSHKHLEKIVPKDCAEFVSAWQFDREEFANYNEKLPLGLGAQAASEHLGLPVRVAEFGDPDVRRRTRHVASLSS